MTGTWEPSVANSNWWGSSVVYLILDVLDLLHDGRHGCGSEGRGFEVGEVRRLLARAALFVRMRKGGRSESERGSGRWRKEGSRSVVRV
jgi:hypothetical protein